MIDFNNYQERAITTKIYASEIGVPYVVLGIIGEVGEFIEKFSETEDDTSNDLLTKELGDIYWYLAAFFSEVGQKMGDHIDAKEPLKYYDPVGELSEAVFNIAELTKKYLRDEYPVRMGSERFDKIKHQINQIHLVLLEMCASMDVELETILEANIAKLQSRKERGVLGGDGDTR